MRPSDRVDGYLPIAAYALIGDCRSAALVGHDGSIDWLCLPRFDDPSIFGRLVDARKGGHWQLVPRGPYEVVQRYSDRTNVLRTTFMTRTGRVVIADFMPQSSDTQHHHARPHDHPRVVRVVECLAGEVAMRHEFMPAPDYARSDDAMFRCEDGLVHGDTDTLHVCVRATCALTGPRQVIEMRAGDTVAFGLATSDAGQCPTQEWSYDRAVRLARETHEFWWRWIGGVRYDGPYQEPVWRSALALKLMTYAPTGAIIAAPTTSLPEVIGGARNWDYRFTWLRDASFTLFALFQLGLKEEAHAFFDWLSHLDIVKKGLDNLYTLDGARRTHESTLDHLAGYRDSRPVRIGNGAARQLQLDVYGEVLDSAYLYARFGGDISQELWDELRDVVDLAIARWQEPDSSIWEVRGGEQHFTYSKVMCWTAVDRGLRLAERYGLPHDSDRWRSARRAIHRRVVMQAWSEKHRAFTQSLGSDVLDAAVLRMSQVRFLEAHDPRMISTVDAVARELRSGILVNRYRARDTDDGLHSDEGAFLMCSFWLADAFAHLGRLEDAQRLFERLLTFQSWSGLFSEESDGRTGELLGNYPQAFTHLALVGAAVNIERLRHRQIGPHGLKRATRRAASAPAVARRA